MTVAAATTVAVPVVFLAGVASFLSPCVLPLVPGYLSYMGGISSGTGTSSGIATSTRIATRVQGRLLVATAAFVLGFTAVFVSLGMSASLIGSFLASNRELLTRLAGGLIVLMGLAFLGVLPLPWLYAERRPLLHPAETAPGSFFMGLAFGFGWTPCLGPTLAAALGIAASEASPGRGALLLFIYAMGLGLPFILSALGLSRMMGALRWFKEHQRAVTGATGLMLIAVGLLFVFNRVFYVSILLQQALGEVGLDFWSRL
jgi:cytochrome c-type biogenesis protein